MKFSAKIYWCARCHAGYASVGELPHVCPNCEQPAFWLSFTESSPLVAWELTYNDRQFLRQIRVTVS